MTISSRLLIPLTAMVLMACQAPGDSVPTKPAEPFQPAVAIRPLAVSLARGATQAFQAEINYEPGVRPFRQPVAWRVVEPGGGEVTPAGLYTAPQTAGTFHVEAAREDFPGVKATATVTVK